jgi:hypothetical protein
MPDSAGSSWKNELHDGVRFLAIWSSIAAAILLMGALSARGAYLLTQIHEKKKVSMPFGCDYWVAVLVFSVCGGVAIGLLFLSWRIARPGGFGWGMGVIVLSLILIAIFIWPTPFKYYKTKNPQELLRVTRATGYGEIIPAQNSGRQTTDNQTPLPQAPVQKP